MKNFALTIIIAILSIVFIVVYSYVIIGPSTIDTTDDDDSTKANGHDIIEWARGYRGYAVHIESECAKCQETVIPEGALVIKTVDTTTAFVTIRVDGCQYYFSERGTLHHKGNCDNTYHKE